MKRDIGNRTAVLETINSVNKRAEKIDSFDKTVKLPDFYIRDKKINISKSLLKHLISKNYDLSSFAIDNAIADLESDGILGAHIVPSPQNNEAIHYLTYINDVKISPLGGLRQLFKTKSSIK